MFVAVPKEKITTIAAACAGVAAWASIGSLAVANTDGGLTRFGLLPPLWLLPILGLGFAGIAWAMRLSTGTSLPLFFSLILLLPWVPGPIPPAFLLWTGRIAIGVWLALIVALVAAKRGRVITPGAARARRAVGARGAHPSHPTHLSHFTHPVLAPLVAAITAFALYSASGWSLAAGRTIPNGDEPHYLVITQSLLSDRDLQIENNHARGDYREYFGGVLRPDYLRRGINGQIYSIHAPGLPLIVAPAYALFGYSGVVIFLSLIAALGSALLWRASYMLTESRSAAWFGWAAGALTVPFFFEAFAAYPDGLAATLVLFAALPLLEPHVGRIRWIAVGAALALLPWLHTRFALISAVVGVLLLMRLVRLKPDTTSRILAFLLVPAVSAVAWFGFFRAVYGTFNPSAPYGGSTQSSPLNILNGLSGLLFDQQFGILPNAPVYGFCFVGMIVLARRRPRLALELSTVSAIYLLSVSAFHMWWGGSSSPARFAVPVLPLLALPGAWLWKSTPNFATRAIGLATLLVSLAMTTMMVAVDDGRLAYNVRDGYARAALWLSPLVHVPQGLPSFFRQTPAGLVLRAGFWITALAAVVFAARATERKGASRGAIVLTMLVGFAIAAMSAMTAVWKLDRFWPAVRPETSQLNLLQNDDSRIRPTGIVTAPLRFESPESILSRINISTSYLRSQRAQRYGPAVVYFFDERAFVEEPGFWIRGGGSSQVAAAHTEPAFAKGFGGQDGRVSLQLFVRNAPVVNRLAIKIDGQEQILNLQPREERIVPIQIAQDRPAALIRFHTDTGFRPSEVEPESTDQRFLGVWIEFR